MTSGEILSLLAVLIAFFGLVVTLIFSLRKDSAASRKEEAQNVRTLSTIQNDLQNIGDNIARIERKVDKIDERSNIDHEKIIENDTKIKNLEKEVFRKGA